MHYDNIQKRINSLNNVMSTDDVTSSHPIHFCFGGVRNYMGWTRD